MSLKQLNWAQKGPNYTVFKQIKHYLLLLVGATTSSTGSTVGSTYSTTSGYQQYCQQYYQCLLVVLVGPTSRTKSTTTDYYKVPQGPYCQHQNLLLALLLGPTSSYCQCYKDLTCSTNRSLRDLLLPLVDPYSTANNLTKYCKTSCNSR